MASGLGASDAASTTDPGAAGAALSFHEFLDRMKQPGAADLVRKIRGFMTSFLAKQPEPDQDGESVQTFLQTTEALFTSHPLWKGASADELECTGEALEKYLMIKLFSKAFAPVAEEKERDENLSLKMAALGTFLQPKHLDVPAQLQNDGSWLLAEKELQKMGSYKSPRDKLQCILNCCRVVNNLLLNASISQASTTPAAMQGNGSDVKPPGADDFLPALIYVTVKANPPQLLSNLLYIQRYRSATRLCGEPSYFYTNLVSAASFLESVTASQLSIDKDDFDRLMEAGYKHAREAQQGGSPGEGAPGEGAPGEGTPQSAEATLTQPGTTPPIGTGSSQAIGAQSEPMTTPQRSSVASAPVKETVATVEELQQRPDVIAEVLRADASGELGRQFRFLYTKESDVRVGDVAELLKGYKDLALKYYSLCRAIHGAQLVLHHPAPASKAGTQEVQLVEMPEVQRLEEEKGDSGKGQKSTGNESTQPPTDTADSSEASSELTNNESLSEEAEAS